MCAPKWLLRVRLWHLFVCHAAGAVLLLRVRLGRARPCAISCFLAWMDVNVKHGERGGKSQKKNVHNGKMRVATWEDPRYACHYQTADGGGLFVCGLYLLFTPPPPPTSRLLLAAINEDQKIPALEGAGKQADTTEDHSREPTATLVRTRWRVCPHNGFLIWQVRHSWEQIVASKEKKNS